jgi:hypothetical protein
LKGVTVVEAPVHRELAAAVIVGSVSITLLMQTPQRGWEAYKAAAAAATAVFKTKVKTKSASPSCCSLMEERAEAHTAAAAAAAAVGATPAVRGMVLALNASKTTERLPATVQTAAALEGK